MIAGADRALCRDETDLLASVKGGYFGAQSLGDKFRHAWRQCLSDCENELDAELTCLLRRKRIRKGHCVGRNRYDVGHPLSKEPFDLLFDRRIHLKVVGGCFGTCERPSFPIATFRIWGLRAAVSK